ncbi:TPA: hypothetical protein ACSRQ6_002630 [Enterobacter hormaechei subsp. steigerwaltii]|nr:hypothetical protein [Enterobacter hormaechei]ELC7457432.1 hypothetical protein [Enterobacter hormaechei]HED1785929.1 hypothetical protein [Enterobacter hormaechei subsp. steigerwaltii]
MVRKQILSKYQQTPPDSLKSEDDGRIIDTPSKLYPEMLAELEKCAVIPVNRRTLDMMQIHHMDAGDLRKWLVAACKHGQYINSQWCQGSNPSGFFACDAYTVSGMLYMPHMKKEVETVVYVKMCITKTGATVAVISIHPSYQQQTGADNEA